MPSHAIALRDQLVEDYSPFVRFIAQQICSRLPAGVELDDLVSAGFIGLMDAIDRFDPTRDNKFKTYAEWRIRGAILDELRAMDDLPRSARDQLKRLEAARGKLEGQLGRAPVAAELAETLQVSLVAYFRMASIERMGAARHLDVHEASIAAANDVEAEVELKQLRQELIAKLDELGLNERLVLSLRYFEGLSLKEIGRLLEVSESRVCQVHRAALQRIKDAWD